MLYIFFKPVLYERLWLKDKISKRQNTELAHSAPNVTTPAPHPHQWKSIVKISFTWHVNYYNILRGT